MYIPKTLHEENVHNNYLMGLLFSTSWRVGPKKKNSLWGSGFLEFCMQKYRILRKWKFCKFFPWASLARSALEPPWASLARSVPKPSPPEAISSRQRPPPPAMPAPQGAGCESEVKWVKWSEWKWRHFGPLFFLKFIYIIDNVYA